MAHAPFSFHGIKFKLNSNSSKVNFLRNKAYHEKRECIIVYLFIYYIINIININNNNLDQPEIPS